jgi:hypothetical protein
MLTVGFEWRFQVNQTKTVREWLGAALRSLACRVDGRLSLAIDIDTSPPISSQQKIECIKFGFGQMKIAIEDTVRAEATERILDVVMKEKHGTPT